MNKLQFFATLSSVLCLLSAQVSLPAEDFNRGWLFREGNNTPVQVNLPHDAMIHMERAADVPAGSSVAFFKGGVFTYEKEFDAPAEWLSSHVTFHFGGVYNNSKVYINGKEAGGRYNGYFPFDVCADGYLREGKNVITVVADNSKLLDSRWYSGAGIYRSVTLKVQPSSYIESVQVRTITYDPPRVQVQTRHSGGKVSVQILDAKGAVIARADGDNVEIPLPGAGLWSAESPVLYTVKATLTDGDKTDTVSDHFGIRLLEWSTKGLLVNGEQVLLKGGCFHSDNGVIGSAEFPETALRRVKIMKQYGFNALRSAHNPCSEDILRAADSLGMYIMDETWDMWFNHKGANDYATHFMDYYLEDVRKMVEKDYNHPSVIMYSIGNEVGEPCMEGGMDVAREIVKNFHLLDPTRPTTAGTNLTILASAAGGGGFGFAGRRERRTYEGPNQLEDYYAATGKKPKSSAKSEEKKEMPENLMQLLMGGGQLSSEEYNALTEFAMEDMSNGLLTYQIDSLTTPFLDLLDIAGYNYASARYEMDSYYHPNRIIVGSETFPKDLYTSWEMVKRLPYLLGDFMWCGWDYLGEVGIGGWIYDDEGIPAKQYPCLTADTGSIDITGNPTGEAFFARAIWEENPGAPYICVRPAKDLVPRIALWRSTNSIPSWSWKGCEGKKVTVEVFSSAKRVKLYLNGKKVGKAKVVNGVATFEIPYAPGVLEARAYMWFWCCGKSSLRSAKGKEQIAILPDRTTSPEGGLVFLDVTIVGENGQVESNGDRPLSVEVKGAELLGYGSSLPATEYRYDGGCFPTRYGRSLAVIRTMEKGHVTVTVSGEGLPTASVELKCE